MLSIFQIYYNITRLDLIVIVNLTLSHGSGIPIDEGVKGR